MTDKNSSFEVKYGRHVTWVGFWSNVGLSVLKILAGIFGRSSAMIADGIHSASDLLTDVVVLVVIGASRKKPDLSHTYGHGKIETFASFIIAVLLAVVGIGILIDGVERIVAALNGEQLLQPGWIALVMAIASIVVKEWLFRYTRNAARRIESKAMEANAWHHRSDAFSSFATLLGVAGAMFLGVKWRILDPIAAVLVCFLILAMAYQLGIKAIKELLEASLPPEITESMEKIIATTPGVITFHHFRSRQNGNAKIVDVHIMLSPQLSIVQAHDIATNVENRLKDAYGDVIVSVHMEPYFAGNAK